MRLWGQAIDPHAAWLIDRGMRTLAVRMERHNTNGMAVAQWARADTPASRKVHYPGLAVPPRSRARQGGARRLRRHGGARAQGRGQGRGAAAQAAQADHPRAQPGRGGDPGLGAAPHLAQEHRRRRARAKIGIPDGFLRLSCGIEDAEDIIADLEQAVEEGREKLAVRRANG